MRMNKNCYDCVTRLLCQTVLLCLCLYTRAKPVPGETVTQTGEPSHFQVDDRAAEIEVNANPAGVKVNAKPASLQVVAKPGTPAVPIFHPAIHLAPHLEPPPIIHHDPVFYHGGIGPYDSFHHGHSLGWSYFGLKRNQLPSDQRKYKGTNEHKKERNHKSDIPRLSHAALYSKPKYRSNQKRQFIQASPSLGPLSYGSLLPLKMVPLQQAHQMVPFIVGALPKQASESNLLENPYYRSNPAPTPGLSMQIPQSQSLTNYANSGSGEDDITKLYQALLGQAAALGPLGQSPNSPYSLSNQMSSLPLGVEPPNMQSSLAGYNLPYSVNPLARQLSAQLPVAGTGGLSTNGLPYPSSNLAPMFGIQPASPSLRDLLGGHQVLGPSLYFPYIARPAMVSRSKVPKAPRHKAKQKRSATQQNNHNKRQMIFNPNSLSTPQQQYQSFQPSVIQSFTGQQPSPIIPREQQSQMFAGTQPFMMGSQRSSFLRPILPFAQSRSIANTQSPMLSSNMPPTFSGVSSPYLPQFQAASNTPMNRKFQGNFPIESLNSNLVTPIEVVRPLQRHLTNSFTPNLLSSFSPSRMRLPFNSFPRESSFGLRRRKHRYSPFFHIPRRPHFRHGIRYWRMPHWRNFHRRPLYRRRLHSYERDDSGQTSDTRVPDTDNEASSESVTQVGGYTVSDNDADRGGEVLVDKQNVGFGPITVEAKTEKGLIKSKEDDDLKRNKIPTGDKQSPSPFIAVNHPK